MLYFPNLWCRLREEAPESYGLCWNFNRRDFIQTLLITGGVLVLLTVVALHWPWDTLPHKRTLGEVLNMGAGGLAAAVIEETFFRGWLQPLFAKRYDPYVAIVLTNLIFTPIHLFVAPNLISLCIFFPGCIMGWLKHRYNNLFPPALFHFLGNVWAIWFFPVPIEF